MVLFETFWHRFWNQSNFLVLFGLLDYINSKFFIGNYFPCTQEYSIILRVQSIFLNECILCYCTGEGPFSVR